MKIAVVGPGALGCLLAARLTKVGLSPVLIDYKEDRATILNQKGIVYSEGDNTTTFPMKVCLPEHITSTFDIIVFCVKSYSLNESITFCNSLLKQAPLALFMQNGISHLNPNLSATTTPCFGSTTEGAYLSAPGHVQHAGRGVTSLGFLSPPPPKADKLLSDFCKLLIESGLHTEKPDSIKHIIWQKLLVNIGINGLTAIYDCKNGNILEMPHIKKRMLLAVTEAQKVANLHNVQFATDPIARVTQVCENTCNNISSMLQDIRSERKTEIDAINGALLSLAKEVNLYCPENEKITAQVKKLEKIKN